MQAGGTQPGTPRVLLIEDDPSIRRFVALALEDEALQLLEAQTVQQALQRLRQDGPFRLVLSDLMLPDGSGTEVLQAMAAQPALRAGARVVVFSAGLGAEARRELESLGVDDTLLKPAGVADLLRVTQQALAAGSPAAPAAHDADAAAAERYFAGDRALFDAFRDSCRARFAVDLASGDAALAAADWQALRRLAHSLKSVLQMLGCDGDAAQAGRLEADAALGQAEAARDGWAQLRRSLQRQAGA